MNENTYQQFKKNYKNIQPPEYLVKHGWEDLSHRLPDQSRRRRLTFTYGFLFAGLLICLSAGIVGVAQTAKPGTTLYPVKAASEQVVETITNTLAKKSITPMPVQSPNSIIKAKPSPTHAITTPPAKTEKKNLQTEFEIIPTIQKQSSSTSQESKSENKGQSSNEKKQVEGVSDEKHEEKNGNSGNRENEKQEQKNDNPGKGNQKKD